MATKHLPFYNIDQAVGRGGLNKSDDVMLIQFMLAEVGKVPPHPIPPPVTPLTPNGLVSDTLNEWILWFQNSVKNAGGTIIVDGRIDPGVLHGGDYYNGRGTIVHLNGAYRHRFKSAHNALENAPNCPGQLRSSFITAEV